MPNRSSKGRKDINQLAKSIVGIATGEEDRPPEKNKAAQELGRLGGKKGGKARGGHARNSRIKPCAASRRSAFSATKSGRSATRRKRTSRVM